MQQSSNWMAQGAKNGRGRFSIVTTLETQFSDCEKS